MQFQLLNDYVDPARKIDRNGAIRRLTVIPTGDSRICRDLSASPGGSTPAGLCATGKPSVMLSGSLSATVTVTAPIPAMYDVHLEVLKSDERPQHVNVAIDGRPSGGALLLTSAEKSPYSSLQLPPMYLTARPHAITVTRVVSGSKMAEDSTLTLDEISLLPRYPDINSLTPTKFGSSDPSIALMNPMSTITASWKLYGYNYDFYTVQAFGSTSDNKPTTLEVVVNGQMIGTTMLSRDGSSSQPLAVELANGGTHTIALRPLNLADDAKAMIYSVQIKPYVGSSIYAGTAMRWAKKDNRAVQSDQSIVHFPANVQLTQTVNVSVAGIYTLTARGRRTGSMDQAAMLRLDVDGWHIAEDALQADGDWTTLTFTTYLPAGTHDLQFTWQGGTRPDRLDIAYTTLQQQGIDPPS